MDKRCIALCILGWVCCYDMINAADQEHTLEFIRSYKFMKTEIESLSPDQLNQALEVAKNSGAAQGYLGKAFMRILTTFASQVLMTEYTRIHIEAQNSAPEGFGVREYHFIYEDFGDKNLIGWFALVNNPYPVPALNHYAEDSKKWVVFSPVMDDRKRNGGLFKDLRRHFLKNIASEDRFKDRIFVLIGRPDSDRALHILNTLSGTHLTSLQTDTTYLFVHARKILDVHQIKPLEFD